MCGGSTPLHVAAGLGHASAAAALLASEALRAPGFGLELRRARNMRGLTPLNVALASGHHGLARLLVEGGRSRRSGGRIGAAAGPPAGGGEVVVGGDEPGAMPEELWQRVLCALRRAAVLSQLREIAQGWEKQGLAKPGGAWRLPPCSSGASAPQACPAGGSTAARGSPPARPWRRPPAHERPACTASLALRVRRRGGARAGDERRGRRND